jgi:hypothetical protein
VPFSNNQTPYILDKKVKSKATSTLKSAKKAQRGRDVHLYSFFNLASRWAWVFHATPRPFYPRERDTTSMAQKDVWDPRPVWTDEENIAPTGICSTDRPARIESLYRLNEFQMFILSNVTPQTRNNCFIKILLPHVEEYLPSSEVKIP